VTTLPAQNSRTNPDGTPTGAYGPRPPMPIPADALKIDALQVLRRYGNRSHMWLVRRLANDPAFPKPTYYGRLRFWKVAELDAYDRVCEQRAQARTEQQRNT
jgi:hypothetical protein